MLRSIVLLVVLLLGAATPAAAGGVDVLDAENGFRGVRFGERPEAIPGLELVSERGAGGTRVYVRPGDELRFGSATLDGVTYGFHEDRLYFVALFTSGRRNTQAVLSGLEQAYGPGKELPGEAREFLWQGSRVILHFREDPATGMGMVGFTSVPIDERVRAERATLPAAAAD